ncbi:MAG: LysR family transcriptional regulator [Pseudomonadota bacterium]
MLEDLRPMAIFANVAEAGSFRGAARLLSISPSVVSHHIGALEERLGVALFYRSTRRVTLTEDGEKLLVHARRMAEAAQAGLSDFVQHADSPVGTLNVALPAALSAHPIVPLIATFSTTYPGIALNLEFSDQRRDLIASGMDVAIRMGELTESADFQQDLSTEPRLLVASKAYVTKRRLPRTPTALDEWDFIGFAPRLSPLKLTHGRRSHTLCAVAKINVDNSLAMLRLTLAGAGMAALPESIIRPDLASGELVHLLPDWSLPSLPIQAVWPRNSPRHGLSARFVGYLAEELTRAVGNRSN